MKKRLTYIALPVIVATLFSCSGTQSRNHGPIVLGDSAAIVTETDPEKLRDLVTDLQPVIKTAENKDSADNAAKALARQAEDSASAAKSAAAAAVATPTKTTTPPPPAQLSGTGVKADFKVVAVLLPNVNAKLAGKANLERASGAVYSWVSGTVPGNQLQVTQGVTKVSQRYQTVVAIKNDMGTLPLETLTTTTDWKALNASGNSYKITGLDAKSLDYSDASRSEIRNAVSKAARKHRFNRRKTQEWEESVRNARAVTQKPLVVVLRSVMWKIDGKDAAGKAYSRQIRLDMPL